MKRIILALTLIAGISLGGFSQLFQSGIYTIGGTSPDFTDFSTVLSRLKSSGISGGPVIFHIREGQYNEQLNIEVKRNSSNTDRVTFTFDPSNTGDVIITDSGNEGDPIVFIASGTNYITVRGLTIMSKSGSRFTRKAIEVFGVRNNEIVNNKIKREDQNTPRFDRGIFIGISYENKIVGNQISDCQIGIVVQGNKFASEELRIDSNTIVDWTRYGILAKHSGSLFIRHNTINSLIGAEGWVNSHPIGVSVSKVHQLEFSHNSIEMSVVDDCTGLKIEDISESLSSAPNPKEHNLIYNNTIVQTNTPSSIGSRLMIIRNTMYTYILHNSGYSKVSSSSQFNEGIVTFSGCDSTTVFMNNAIGNYADGKAYKVYSSTHIEKYNCFYAKKGTSSSTALGAGSFEADPKFKSATDLHVDLSSPLESKGVPTLIAKDKEGNIRTSAKPDLGAYEFNGSGGAISVLSLNKSNDKLNIYPNPTYGQVQFSSTISYRLVNALGSEVKSEESVEQADFSGLNAGVYYLMFEDNSSQKLVIR